jgi:heme exporter protein D
MQLAFSAANSAGSGSLWFQIAGFVLFLVWLASMVATIVGIIGAVVRSVRQHRSG